MMTVSELREGDVFILNGEVFLCVCNSFYTVECYNFIKRRVTGFIMDALTQHVQLVDCELTVEKLTSLREEDK